MGLHPNDLHQYVSVCVSIVGRAAHDSSRRALSGLFGSDMVSQKVDDEQRLDDHLVSVRVCTNHTGRRNVDGVDRSGPGYGGMLPTGRVLARLRILLSELFDRRGHSIGDRYRFRLLVGTATRGHFAIGRRRYGSNEKAAAVDQNHAEHLRFRFPLGRGSEHPFAFGQLISRPGVVGRNLRYSSIRG